MKKDIYEKAKKIMGGLTPLKADCGALCGGICCRGDENTGMRLFPREQSTLSVKPTEYGARLAVCCGKCNRDERPLACKIFPFFPVVDERGRVFVEKDYRAWRMCPLLSNSDEILFDRRFFRAVKRVGKLLAKNEECLEFMRRTTEEIDRYRTLYGADE